MMTISYFKARIIECDKLNNKPFYKFKNLETNEIDTVPCWCLDGFVVFDEDLLDEDGHLKLGAEVQLRKMENGNIYPGLIYEKRSEPMLPNSIKPLFSMSKESLYDGIALYGGTQNDINTLWSLFSSRCDSFPADILIEGIKVRNKEEEEQLAFLKSALRLDGMQLPVQEGANVEFKSSFVHTASPIKNNERTMQYRNIFSEIAAFANSHIHASVYIGINNDGSIKGVEGEMLHEVPFNTRADFEADFLNQLFMVTNNNILASSISLNWYKTEDEHIFCKITIPEWNGDIIFLNGSELYIRGNACKRRLKNSDMIQYIVANYKATA